MTNAFAQPNLGSISAPQKKVNPKSRFQPKSHHISFTAQRYTRAIVN